ncbi:L,D-transpeptidase [Aquamicrobium zhengzhouense]|uniref:L,D-transpeptidase n=1 Tax=Aquamicrobium zhengzhouense TaxID=2781738 RepID=A0ABS0SD27_9HYPH|nr:L,D-transpeptidase [Aquamicrobium zhengzhouense]MBI1621171.1 L,D-transpeptidase [Aquamicrobium zhengzhouense]
MAISRRGFLIGLPLFAAGCSVSEYGNDIRNYAAVSHPQFPLAALSPDKIKPELRRREVEYKSNHKPDTIVVNTPERRLYYVLGDNKAIRYGIGVGKEGLALRGNATIGRKAEWPSWTPTGNMIARDPRNRQYAGGVPGGLNNPLGARALYLYRGGKDTMFRIHGTNQPQSIGLAMSSGCIRMLNHDIIDLYNRTLVGTNVVVIQA